MVLINMLNVAAHCYTVKTAAMNTSACYISHIRAPSTLYHIASHHRQQFCASTGRHDLTYARVYCVVWPQSKFQIRHNIGGVTTRNGKQD